MESQRRTPEYWRGRAEEALVRALDMHDPDAIKSMLAISDLYKRLALMAERAIAFESERSCGKQPKPG